MNLTVPVFSFEHVSHSRDGTALSCNCSVAKDMPFFNGHFPSMPIMPAVAQIEMIQALLQQQSNWNKIIAGGSGLKFTGRIQPGDTLAIHLQCIPSGDISFTVENKDAVVSKGILQLAGGTLD